MRRDLQEFQSNREQGLALVDLWQAFLRGSHTTNLANAREAMPCGGRFMLETSLVELGENSTRGRRGMKPGKYAVLPMSDNGTGMDFNTQSRCFEPFFTTKESGCNS